MKKTRSRGVRKIITGLLSLSMVTAMFAGISVKAEEEEPNEELCGLLVTERLDTVWDDAQGKDVMLVTEDGFPGYYEEDENGEQVIKPDKFVRGDWMGASLSGTRYFFVYKESADAEPIPVKAEDLELRYYYEEDAWPRTGDDGSGDLKATGYKTENIGILENAPDQRNWKGVVDFIPDDSYVPSKENYGHYAISYKGSNKEEDSIVLSIIDYPQVGFYSAPELSRENLLSNRFSDQGVDYSFFDEAEGDEVIYLHLGSVWSDNEITLANGKAINEEDMDPRPAFRLNLYGADDSLTGNMSENDQLEGEINDYLDVEKVEGKEGWYKLTFADKMVIPSEDEENNEENTASGFDLTVNVVITDGYYNEQGEWQSTEGATWYTEAWLSGHYQALGLYAQMEGEDFIHTEYEWIGNVMVNPNHLRISLGKTTLSNGTPKKEKLTAAELKGLKVEKVTEWDDNGPSAYEAVTAGEDYTYTQDGDYADFVFYYQDTTYRISVDGVEGSVFVSIAEMSDISFFSSAKRPAVDEKVENMLLETKVNEGKTPTVYAILPEIAEEYLNEEWAFDMDTLTFKAEVNGKEKSSYIEKGDSIKSGNHIIGYELKITDQVKEDFVIVATVKKNNPDWGSMSKFFVTYNKLKEIKIATAPTKTTYTEGEKFDATGMVVNAVYEDGTEEAITDYTVKPSEELKATDTSVTISYLGKEVTQAITVNVKATPTPEITPTVAPSSGPGAEVTAEPSTEPTVTPSIEPTATPSAEPTVTPSAEPTAEATTKPTAQTTTQPQTTKSPSVPKKKGTKLTDKSTKAKYTVTSSDSKNPTVEYKAPTKKNVKSAIVPDTVTIDGVTYKVTSIANNAFKGNKKLKKVTIGKNVTTIGKNAFKGCTALKTLTLPAKTNKIGKNAFSGCKNLKTLTIKSKKLTAKTVENGAFKGLPKKVTVKVPKGKTASYKKLLKKKGLPAKAKVK